MFALATDLMQEKKCVVTGRYHYPNMEGKRVEVSNWQHCQSVCRVTAGCKYFSFWPDQGCQLQSEPKEYRHVENKAYEGVMSGPAICPGDEELGSMGFGGSNFLDSSTLYCLKNSKDACCSCGVCCLPFCHADTNKWTTRDGCPNAATGFCDAKQFSIPPTC